VGKEGGGCARQEFLSFTKLYQRKINIYLVGNQKFVYLCSRFLSEVVGRKGVENRSLFLESFHTKKEEKIWKQ